MRTLDFYKHYKRLMIIPIILLIASFVIIGLKVKETGFFIERGISLKGGITLTTELIADQNSVTDFIQDNFENREVVVKSFSSKGEQAGLIIEMDIEDKKDIDNLISLLKDKYGEIGNVSIRQTSSSLGTSFFNQALKAILIAFGLMAITVIIYFRKLTPSVAVIFAALADIVGTIAVIDLLDIKLSTASMAAFLMLIGYSVDTDILLTTKMLKRTEDSLNDRLTSATKTGLLMTITTLSVVTAGMFLTKSDVLFQIFLILLIGLIFDIINTWLTNVGIMLWYLEKKHGKIENIQ